MRRVIKIVLLCITVFLVCLILSNRVDAAEEKGTVYINGTFNYEKAYECLDILNSERSKIGLNELEMDKDVLDAAMIRASEISLLFEHTRPNGKSCTSLCTAGKILAENIAAGSSSAQGAIDQWLTSTMGHKENMLSSSWKSVGIGCFTNSFGMTFWVQCFGASNAITYEIIPSNINKDAEIETKSNNLDLRWYYNRTKELEIELESNQAYNLSIIAINKGWPQVSVRLENKSFDFSSSNNKFAKVDLNGIITANKSGTATVTVNVKNMEDVSISMNVNVPLPFEDVQKEKWYYSAVEFVYNNDIMNGLNQTTFGPGTRLTRGMLATIIHRMENNPNVTKGSPFSDVKDSSKYYYKAVVWAAENKIVSGYKNGKFGPSDYVTREQLAVILYNYAKFKNKDLSKTDDLNGFVDADRISNWALGQVKWAVATKVVTGSNNILNPKGNASRAEVAAMIQKYCINVGR